MVQNTSVDGTVLPDSVGTARVVVDGTPVTRVSADGTTSYELVPAPNQATSPSIDLFNDTDGSVCLGAAINPWIPVNSGGAATAWSIVAGALPPGLTLNATNGQISGTPTSTGSFSWTVRATNASGSDDFADSIVVNTDPDITTSASIGAMTSGTAITTWNPTNTGDTGGITWSIAAGAIPTGLSFNTANGQISGTPTATGPFSWTVRATNECGSSDFADSVTVGAALAAPDLSTSAAMPDGTVGAAYSYTPTNTGGAVATWSATGLPTGVTINATTGVVSGTPTTAATFGSVVITATNATGSDTHNDSVVIAAALAAPNLSTSAAMPDGTIGAAYTYTPTNTGGAVATWSATGLPTGLSINASTGVVSGTPTAAATFGSIVITATNATGSDTHNDSVVIAAALAAPNIVCVGNQTFADGTSVGTVNSVASNSGGAIASYGISPGLPAGLAFNTSTGAITGTPSGGASGPTTYTVTATNATGSDTCTFTIEVTAAAVGGINAAPFFFPQLKTTPGVTLTLQFFAAGGYNFSGASGSGGIGDWSDSAAPGVGSGWEIYFDGGSWGGVATTPSGAATDTWISLGSTVTFTLPTTTGGTNFASGQVHFRPAGSGLNPGDAGTTLWALPWVEAAS